MHEMFCKTQTNFTTLTQIKFFHTVINLYERVEDSVDFMILNYKIEINKKNPPEHK